ncbi:MAG TPA: FHA domain-containing protein [Agromyces sp.]|nr:FHA domain-containing protein [Agromyces sp.]
MISIPVDGFRSASLAPTGSASAVGDRSADAPARPHTTPRFVLTFSTGEVRTVFGTGLIGRRPLPQPGESFDQLVQIADRSLSVSKTHLEFGEHDGVLWIADRFSANGTVVRRPDDGALRCEPGRRYLVPRGSRVELAEQFFAVE